MLQITGSLIFYLEFTLIVEVVDQENNKKKKNEFLNSPQNYLAANVYLLQLFYDYTVWKRLHSISLEVDLCYSAGLAKAMARKVLKRDILVYLQNTIVDLTKKKGYFTYC